MRLITRRALILSIALITSNCKTSIQDEPPDGSTSESKDSSVSGDQDVDSGKGQDDGDIVVDSGSLGACGNASDQLFPPNSIWNTPIDGAATKLDSESDKIIDYLRKNHTDNARFQIDFSLKVLNANASTSHRDFTTTNEFYSPDCDPAAIPVPMGGALEGESGYACESDGDCHLLVVDFSTCRLHEIWRANLIGDSFEGGCQVIWDLTSVYPADMRGDYCTSADAAGLPISAHLFSADEIVVGRIQHAIRFILPNKHIRDSIYVHPATHSTSSPHGASGGSDAVPYGARLRLKSTTNLSGLNNSAKIVARALMKYGMILSDGGKITFTAMADDFTTAKWAQVGLGPNDLKSLRWSDFEMVEGGTRYNVKNGDCQHQTDTEVIGAPHAYPTKHTSTTFRIWRPN